MGVARAQEEAVQAPNAIGKTRRALMSGEGMASSACLERGLGKLDRKTEKEGMWLRALTAVLRFWYEDGEE